MLDKFSSLSHSFSVRVLKVQYLLARRQLNNGLKQGAVKDAECSGLLKKIYALVNDAVITHDQVLAYKSLDLLKTAFGGGFIRPDESSRLLNITVAAFKAREYDAVGQLIEAYQLLARHYSSTGTGALLMDMTLLFNLFKRTHQEYLLHKFVRCVFAIIKTSADMDGNAKLAALSVLEHIGIYAIKTQDILLFREIDGHWPKLLSDLDDATAERAGRVLAAYLHQVIKRDQPECLAVLVERSRRTPLDDLAVVDAELLAQTEQLMGLLAANDQMKCRLPFVRFMMELALKTPDNMRRTLKLLGKSVSMAVSMRGNRGAFALLRPVLEAGRGELEQQMALLGVCDDKQAAVFAVFLDELALLFKLWARQSGGVTTALDVLADVKLLWLENYKKTVNRHSVGQLCQLIYYRLLENKKLKKYITRYPLPEFSGEELFTTAERRRLGIS